MDGVTLREAAENLPGLIERVERGEDVVLLRDGVPVARLVREAPSAPRTLTAEQRKALDESEVIARGMPPGEPWTFNREEIYAERLERQHNPWPR
jgi:antitoxin (DNA-binding transcriptional repressor) of toxin-antitoxin stability system